MGLDWLKSFRMQELPSKRFTSKKLAFYIRKSKGSIGRAVLDLADVATNGHDATLSLLVDEKTELKKDFPVVVVL